MSATSSRRVTPEMVRQYEEQGYLVIPNVLDADLIQEASSHVEWLQRQHPELRPEQLHHWLMADDPFWLRLVSDERLLDLVEPILGPNIALFASHYICKPGGDGHPVHWHQDGWYWPLEPMEVITAWLAVDDSTVQNGCMRVIPGSHRERRLLAHVPVGDEPTVLHTRLEPSLVDESQAVDVELAAGGVSLHHPFLIHGSNPNYSPKRRCGLTIRYIPTTTRVTKEWTLFLLRGEAVPGINTYTPFPAYRPGEHFPFRR